jgi:hypothetical protein
VGARGVRGGLLAEGLDTEGVGAEGMVVFFFFRLGAGEAGASEFVMKEQRA